MTVSRISAALMLLLGFGLAQAQRPEPRAAPLPVALSKASRIFIGNAGDQENADCLRAYNALYAGLAKLGRLQLVLDPAEADLVVELHYEIALGQAIASNDSHKSVRQFRVVLVDPRAHVVLWSITERTNYAVLQGNRNNNLDETVAKLTSELDALLSQEPTAPKDDSKVKHSVLH